MGRTNRSEVLVMTKLLTKKETKMDKEKLEKGIDRIIRQYTINVVTDEISDYTVLDADVITKMSKELADRIEIDREQLNFLPMIASMLKVFKDYTYQSITEVMFKDMINSIIRECPIKIKEEEADDEKT